MSETDGVIITTIDNDSALALHSELSGHLQLDLTTGGSDCTEQLECVSSANAVNITASGAITDGNGATTAATGGITDSAALVLVSPTPLSLVV